MRTMSGIDGARAAASAAATRRERREIGSDAKIGARRMRKLGNA
jgi:hypothetical protein